MTASELIPWFLVIAGFLVFYIPRILVPFDVGLSANQILGQGKANRKVVSWYPVISCGYLALIIGICAISVLVTKLNPYPEGLSIIALFWGGLGICESIFALSTKIMSVSNRLQYRYIEVASHKIIRILIIQLVASTAIVFLVILYLLFHN